MGIGAKTIQGFVSGLVRSSVSFCCRCSQKHPFVSGVVLLFFLLFLFIPSVLSVVFCTSPVIICIFASVKIYSRTQQSKIQYAKAVSENNSSVESKSLPLDHHQVVSRNGDERPLTKIHMSRRRNFKDKNEEGEAEDSKELKAGMLPSSTTTATAALNIVGNLAAVLDEKGNAFSDRGDSSSQTASVDRGIQTHDVKEKESHHKDHGESSSRNTEDVQALDPPPTMLYSQLSISDLMTGDGQPKKFIIGGGGEVEVAESSDDAEDEDEEGAQSDRNKAVEWNADDQQNLMDLGDSEVERNKRLESLIARRRARKLFKMAIEKAGSDWDSTPAGQTMAPLSIVRYNLLNSPNSHDIIEGMQIPGSAPSILLPTSNPFDIPYDSSEEKPNLMADSFQQEFSAAQFCRHESFCWGPSFLVDPRLDHHDSKFGPYGAADKRIENMRFSKFGAQSDVSTHDQLIDDLLSQDRQAFCRVISTNDLNEAGSQAPKQVKKPVEFKGGEDIKPGNLTAGTTGENKTSDDGDLRSAVDRSEIQMEADSVRDNSSEACSSEASELSFQANVSTNIELKVDKIPQRLSDHVRKSLSSLVPDSVGFHGSSYDSSPFGADRPMMEERLLYREKLPCHSPVYSIASDLQVEVSDVGSPPLPIDGTISPADIESSYDGDVEKVTSGSEEMWGASCHLLGVDENESRSKEVNDISEQDVIGLRFSAMKPNIQDPITPSELRAHVAEHDISKASSSASSGSEIPKIYKSHSTNADNKFSENVKQVTEEMSNFSDALPPKIPQKGVHSEKPEELANTSQKLETEAQNVDAQVVNANDAKIWVKHLTSIHLPQPAEKITSESSQSVKNTSDKPPEQPTVNDGKLSKSEATGETSKMTAGQDDEESVQESKNEPNITEVGVSGVNQSSDIPILSASQPMLVAEQLSSSSSSCSSPRSVLPGKVPKDQIPSSQFEGQIHINVAPAIVDATARNNSMNTEPPEGLILTAPPNALHLVVNPPNGPSTISSSEEETRNSSEQSTGEENLIKNANGPAVNEKLKSVIGSEDASQHQKGNSIEIEVTVSPSNSVGGNKSSSVINGREDINPVQPDSSERKVEATTEASRGESETSEAFAKPSTTPPETVEREAQSNPSPQNSSETIDIKHNVNKTVANETFNKTSSVDKENITDQTKPDKAAAEVDDKHSDEKVASAMSSSKSLIDQENVAETKNPDANKMSNNQSLIDQENAADKTEPGWPAAETEILLNVNEKVADEKSNTKKLVDQENAVEQQKPGKESNSLKTSEDINHEANDLKKENVQTDKFPEHNVAGEPSYPVESEVKSPKKEMETTV